MVVDQYVGFMFPPENSEMGFPSKMNGLRLIAGDMVQLLLTEPGERVRMPEYGTPLRRFVFEQNGPSEFLFQEVERVVREAVSLWEPRVVLNSVKVFPEDSDEHALTVSIEASPKTDARHVFLVNVRVTP